MVRLFYKYKDFVIKVLWILTILVCIKTVFTDYNSDSAYTTVMSYRHLQGDLMFLDMWEPHQTSIFITDMLMWLYSLFVPNFTGVVIYLEICGTLLFFAVGWLIFKYFQKLGYDIIAHLAYMFFIVFRAKQTAFPEFSNMQVLFSTLLFLCLVYYLNHQSKISLLSIGAICLCFDVLSYPSSLLTFLFVVACLIIYSEHKVKDVLVFTGVCTIVGGAYAGYFIYRLGFSNLFEIAKNIINSDTHATVSSSGVEYWRGFMLAIAWVTLSSLLASIIYFILKKNKMNRVYFLPVCGIVLLLSELVLIVVQSGGKIDWSCSFYIIPLILVLVGCLKLKELSWEEQCVWIVGTMISISSFLATVLFTDLGLITIVSYLLLAGIVSFIPIAHMGEQGVSFCCTIVLLALMHRGLVVWGMGQNNGVRNVWEIENIYRKGPNLGIVADYMSCYEALCDYEDFDMYTSASDDLMVIEHWLLDPTVFMYSDAKISNHSVINTPLYNEMIDKYFDGNPNKLPSVIAVDCWYGNLNVSEDTWIMKWVNEHYNSYIDGRYWRFYRIAE